MNVLKIKLLYIFIMGFLPFASYSQQVEGYVFEQEEKGGKQPLFGANLHWKGSNLGTTTNEKGFFSLKKPDTAGTYLIITFIGYTPDTVLITNQRKIEVVLAQGYEAKTVVVEEERKSTYLSKYTVATMEAVGSKELLRAACCNLSESFETNPSVDVNFTDAVTGAKQIRMLGLEGVYTQILKENTPAFRGLANTYGLSYVPGPWIESIQITKGAGSVVNGYESMAGQINVELKKPLSSEPLFLNLYADQMGRGEANLNISRKLNERLGSTLLLHTDANTMKRDMNEDGFLDIPLSKQFSFLNRWEYFDGKKISSQFGINGIFQDRQGGQTNFNPETDKLKTDFYGTGANTSRWEAFGKLGLVFPDKPYKSIGSILSVTDHVQSNYFGLNTYKGHEQSLYANIIYQSILGNTNNKFKTGASFVANSLSEQVHLGGRDTLGTRKELVSGTFLEYTYTYKTRFSAIAGMRVDYHNLFGMMLTPRLHTKYDITKNTILRLSAGRGYRTPYLFNENSSLWASSRRLILEDKIQQEVSWNYGGSLMQSFELAVRPASISLDFYRTDFQDQMIIDLDQNPQEIHIYSLQGRSFANSFQAELNYEPVKNFTIRSAWKYYDVQATYSGELREKPLVPRQRFLTTISYATKYKKWVFDGTALLNGTSRLPVTAANPEEYRLPERSPAFWLFNLQLTRNFKRWSFYTGSENLLDYRQKMPILGADMPFGKYFDASMLWGPLEGRRIYAGLRFRISE